MKFGILLLISLWAVGESDREFDMLVRLNPQICPDFPMKCRQNCMSLNFQIGFCNSNQQCVCVKESRDRPSAVLQEISRVTKVESTEKKQFQYAKDETIEGHLTFFLARMLRLGVGRDLMLRSIQKHPLYRLMAHGRTESSPDEGDDDVENNSRDEKEAVDQKRAAQMKAEILPIIIFRNHKPQKTEESADESQPERNDERTFSGKISLIQKSVDIPVPAEQQTTAPKNTYVNMARFKEGESMDARTFSGKNSLIQKGIDIPVAGEQRTVTTEKGTDDNIERSKEPQSMDGARSDTKYNEQSIIDEKKEDPQVANDTPGEEGKIQLVNGQSMETVRIFVFPAPTLENNGQPPESQEAPGSLSDNKTPTPLNRFQERFLTFLTQRVKDIARERAKTMEESSETSLATDTSPQAIEKTAVLSPEAEEKPDDRKEIALREFVFPKPEVRNEEESATITDNDKEVSISDSLSPKKNEIPMENNMSPRIFQISKNAEKVPDVSENSPTGQTLSSDPTPETNKADTSRMSPIIRIRRKISESGKNANDDYLDLIKDSVEDSDLVWKVQI